MIQVLIKGSTIVTDGWRGYSKIKEIGYKHKISDKKSNEDDEKVLPNIHLVISLLIKVDYGYFTRFYIRSAYALLS